MKLSPNDWLAFDREISGRSLSDFLKLAWPVLEPGQPYVHGWHMDAMALHLEAVAKGDINRLLINIPPGTSKSTLCGVIFPAWLWGPHGKPSSRFIGAGHEQGLAIRDNRKCRLLVESDWYQARWPMKLTSDQNEKTYFENAHTGFRQATAVASMTGRRGDFVLWDDPHSPEKAYSQANRETATRVFNETLPNRLNNPDRSAIIVVMQRLHSDDVSGHILAKDLGYEHLMLPMEFEPDRRCVTSIGWQDPRTEAGELLFPDRFPRGVVDRDKRAMGEFATAGQFQQRPSPRGGGIFKDEWWRYWLALPKLTHRAVYVDTAQKTKQENDYTVLQCWGFGRDGGAYLIDQVRGKFEAPELLVQARAFWNKHKGRDRQTGALREMKVEDKVSGTGLIQTLRREGIPIREIPRATDKLTRAYDAAPQIENGNVYLPEQAAWLSDFLAEASAFPNGAHDDMLDPLMDAVADMATGDTQWIHRATEW